MVNIIISDAFEIRKSAESVHLKMLVILGILP